MAYEQNFDVIVVGGGHAGVEAALASARIGAKTLLLTHNIETIGVMSCNPAIGGIGKGHLVKEIDALGGVMARAADSAGIQFRTLNARKGPAVRATRAQTCRQLYRQAIRGFVDQQENLKVFAQAVDDLIVESDQVKGVITHGNLRFYAEQVILTTGTFLGGVIHIGNQREKAGRAGCPGATALAQRLRALPLRVGRLKTGTPPRILSRSIDYACLQKQPGDTPRPVFSFMGAQADHPEQRSCHITHTNSKTHQIIRDSLALSAMYSGNIEGVGPRYCPSIEDKVVRFAQRDSHQVFLEPEGLFSQEVYPNGMSTSLPFEVQCEFIRSMKGLENAHITRPGYAIEYDYLDPRDLTPSLESQIIQGLFLAGQINGTTGYEEAAAQGILAGINAARRASQQSAWVPKRHEAYLAVMVDDLITLGTLEPYRMFTSRAEYRLLLREDNADARLTPVGHQLGVVDDKRWQAFSDKQALVEKASEVFSRLYLRTDDLKVLTTQEGCQLKEGQVDKILARPEMTLEQLSHIAKVKQAIENIRPVATFSTSLSQALEQFEIQTKYAGYIKRQEDEIARNAKAEGTPIPQDFNYAQISGLSSELKEKLSNSKPSSIAMASRIPGMTPAALSLLLVYLKKHQALNAKELYDCARTVASRGGSGFGGGP